MVPTLSLVIWHRILRAAVYVPHYLEDALERSPLVERDASSAISTVAAETERTLARLTLVNTSFRTLAAELKYQRLVFRTQCYL